MNKVRARQPALPRPDFPEIFQTRVLHFCLFNFNLLEAPPRDLAPNLAEFFDNRQFVI
jgi:hypothetical protein